MVDRINGAPYQGVWVERDVRFVSVTVDTGTAAFLTDLRLDNSVAQKAESVNSELEQVLELIATRGTLLGVSVASDTVVWVMVGYANAFDDAAVLTELAEEMDNTTNQIGDWTGVTVAAAAGFSGAAFGTPA